MADPTLSHPVSLEPGAHLGRYCLEQRIGEGSTGVVWKALDTRLGRSVALKLLPEDLAKDADRLARFEGEARAIAAVNHPHIVTLYSVEEAGGRHFLTMELVEGRSLAELIPANGLATGALLDLATPIAEAVAAAHERGIVHRDLKPRNIVVGSGGRPKVLDFGLAILQEAVLPADISDSPTRTLPSQSTVAGTLAYMSPEQAQGLPLDARSDLFSLGAVFYEMATGRRPFHAGSGAQVLAALLRDTPPAPRLSNPALPPRLDDLILSCLEKDPARRPGSALGVVKALEEIRREPNAPARAAAASVAVLPFADMSREHDQGYFCEGIAEEILIALRRVPGLRVASRAASFRFRQPGLDARDVAAQLGVETLLGGSVRKAEERLRIGVELIDAATGFQIWLERYDRELKDVFAIQDDIARSVAEALKITLTSRDRDALGRTATRDVRAYDYYLRGRSYFSQYDRRGAEFARELYSHAIEHDPGYARAHAGLADCGVYLYLYAGRHQVDLEQALAAARKAVALDPALAEAQASLGGVLSLSGQHTAAEAAFEAAVRLDPGLFEAHYFYARDCFAQGRLEQAVREYEEACRIRPGDYQAPLLMAQVYDDLGRSEDARAARRRGVRTVEEHLRLHPDDVRALYMGANGLVALGERERGLALAERAVALEPQEPMVLYNVACIQCLAGDRQLALDLLERALDAGFTEREWLAHDSNLDAIRPEPRFAALMGRLT